MWASMRHELQKLAATTSAAEAAAALQRLHELEGKRPTSSQVARGAVAGTVAGLAGQLAGGAIKGDLKRGLVEAMQAPTLGGKLLNVGKGALTNAGATAARSAAFGATLPLVRQYLDTGSEKAKVHEYLGSGKKGRVRTEVTKVLGVG